MTKTWYFKNVKKDQKLMRELHFFKYYVTIWGEGNFTIKGGEVNFANRPNI